MELTWWQTALFVVAALAILDCSIGLHHLTAEIERIRIDLREIHREQDDRRTSQVDALQEIAEAVKRAPERQIRADLAAIFNRAGMRDVP